MYYKELYTCWSEAGLGCVTKILETLWILSDLCSHKCEEGDRPLSKIRDWGLGVGVAEGRLTTLSEAFPGHTRVSL